MGIIEGAGTVRRDSLHAGRVRLARFFYDFAVDGGTVGDITLRGATIPSGAVVTDALINYETALDSATDTATAALKIEGAADVNAADGEAAGTWATLGVVRADALTATTAPVVTTAARSVVITVGTEALTAGKFDVTVTYLELA